MAASVPFGAECGFGIYVDHAPAEAALVHGQACLDRHLVAELRLPDSRRSDHLQRTSASCGRCGFGGDGYLGDGRGWEATV